MRINRSNTIWRVIFKPVDVSAGAIVMAIGIFLLGSIQQFPFLDNHLGFFLTCLIEVMWLFMLLSFFLSLFNSEYLKNIFQSPIKSFGAGTWIASSSVMGNLILYRIPLLIPFVKVLLYVNMILWVIFIVLCINQYKRIILKGFIRDTHGILLLSTVSTQSLVCLILSIYKTNTASTLIMTLIMLGIVLYLFSFSLLIIRFSSKYSDIHEWKNTDCIIHGAVSITGLAMTLSGYFAFSSLMVIWYIAFCLFVIVEVADIIRGFKRIKQYGWGRGIFNYHISQWSRNFTFGMFYFFTMKLVDQYSSVGQSLIFQNYFLHVLGWIVLVLITIETCIFLVAILKNVKKKYLSQNKISYLSH